MDNSSKVAVVTGGAKGIGRAITLKLAEERYNVVVADIDKEEAEDMVSSYKKLYPVSYCQTDVSDSGSVRQLKKFVENTFGRLDALVNNAAISTARNAPLQDLEPEYWEKKISTNLTGPMLCSKYFSGMLQNSRGVIINLASTGALMSEPHTEAYSASKGGVVALTHALANSLGPEVRVNAVSPGWIDTDGHPKKSNRSALREKDHQQHPVGRVGRPGDVAELVRFLLSSGAEFISGQNIVIDGGMTRKMIYEQ